MSLPVRCFTCGKVLADKGRAYVEGIENGETPLSVFRKIGVERYCCKRMFLGFVDIEEKLLQYSRPKKDNRT